MQDTKIRKEKRMKQFEYKHGIIDKDLDLDWELSKLGDKGWELFSIREMEDKSFYYFAKREKAKEVESERYHIVNGFGEETYLSSNEIYVNIGNCAGDIWEKSLWKQALIDHVDKDGIHTMYGVFKEFIPYGMFKPNNLEYSLEHIHQHKVF